MQNFTKFSVGNSSLVMDMENGGKIINLVLDGVSVISSQEGGNFTSSGSFLMYPWVNRVQASEKYLFKDQNGFPLHGLYASSIREVEQLEQKQHEVKFKIAPQVFDLEFPKFMETFVLTDKKLSIIFELNEPMSVIPVCFGYHPYLQLGDQKLSDTKFHTNIENEIALDENLLPKFPFEEKKTQIIPGQKYDSLFHQGSFFEIEGKTHTLRIQSNMPYWQIYTPDEYRIAVEPMSFCGNIYKIYGDNDYSKLMVEGIVNIEIRTNNIN